MNKFTRSLMIVAALAVVTVTVGFITYNKSATSSAGMVIPVFNAIDSTIVDGTVVSIDTTAASGTNLKRIVVRPYAGTAITRPRCIGLARGPIARSSRGGQGNVLIWGYHANAKMAASTLTANSGLKVAVVHGALTTSADSLSGQIGVFIGHNSNSTAANARGKVFITAPLGRFFGSL